MLTDYVPYLHYYRMCSILTDYVPYSQDGFSTDQYVAYEQDALHIVS